MLRRILRALFRPRPPPPPPRPPDPRLEADPWLGRLFALLPDRYQLGPDAADGAQVLRRTGRARFNPMPVWVRAAERLVRGDYEVRGDASAANAVAGSTRRRGGISRLRYPTASRTSEKLPTFQTIAAKTTVAFSSSSVWSRGSWLMRGRA